MKSEHGSQWTNTQRNPSRISRSGKHTTKTMAASHEVRHGARDAGMASGMLGDVNEIPRKTFDIHCGGIDNMFPHHEDEIAQSKPPKKPIRQLLFALRTLMVDGQKIIKSLGNFYTLRISSGIYRRNRWVPGTHYRQSLNFSFKALEEAEPRQSSVPDETQGKPTGQRQPRPKRRQAPRGQHRKLQESTSDDLNISAALAALFDLLREPTS